MVPQTDTHTSAEFSGLDPLYIELLARTAPTTVHGHITTALKLVPVLDRPPPPSLPPPSLPPNLTHWRLAGARLIQQHVDIECWQGPPSNLGRMQWRTLPELRRRAAGLVDYDGSCRDIVLRRNWRP